MKRIIYFVLAALIALTFFACDSSSDSDGGGSNNLVESIRNADFMIDVAGNEYRGTYISVTISSDVVDYETFMGTFIHTLTVDGEDMTQYQSSYADVDWVTYYLPTSLVAGQTYAMTYKLQLFVDGVNTLTKEVGGSVMIANSATWDVPTAPSTPAEEVSFYWQMDANNSHQFAFASSEGFDWETYDYEFDEFWAELGVDDRSYTFAANCVNDYSENWDETYLWYQVTSFNYFMNDDLAILSETSGSTSYDPWDRAESREDLQKRVSAFVRYLRTK